MTSVVAFHDLGEIPGPAITGLSRARFASLVGALNDAGWNFVPLIHTFNKSSQDNAIHITLDDAFAAQLDAACAILKPRGIPATAFVVTGSAGGQASWDYMGRHRRHAGWDELAAWVEAGFTVGSHGHRHVDLRRLPDADLDLELQTSRDMLQQRLGVEVLALAYPFGRHDRRVREAARRAGYRIAFTSASHPRGWDALAYPRAVVSCLDTPLSVDRRLAGSTWGRLERGKQAVVGFWAGGTPLWQQLRGDFR